MVRGVEKDPDSDPTASPLSSSSLFSFFFFAALHCLAGQQKAFKKTGRGENACFLVPGKIV